MDDVNERSIRSQVRWYRIRGILNMGRAAVVIAVGAVYDALVQAFEVELQRYTTSKGTIRFQPDSPLSGSLVRKLVRACIARNAARTRLGP